MQGTAAQEGWVAGFPIVEISIDKTSGNFDDR